ncbi:MAG: tetratricopeptide repeat protein [Candidatus Zixiibacteriota bacterium]
MKLLSNHKGYRLIPVSLLCVIMVVAGCATKQDVIRVEEKVNQVRIDQKLLKAQLDNIDSLYTSGAEANTALRADVRSAIDDLNLQLTQMQNQINDISQMLYAMMQQNKSGGTQIAPVKPPTDNTAGAQTKDTATAEELPAGVDCYNLWDSAFKDIRRGQYDIAVSGFQDYLKYCPNGQLADNSQYWIAECYYEMEMHDQAITEYTKLLEKYPDTQKKAMAIFKIGRTYEKQNKNDEALKYYLMLRDKHPESLEYSQVKDKIAEWQAAKKN